MIELRPFEKLGKSDHGWLKANFHFSFADYRNQEDATWSQVLRIPPRGHQPVWALE